MKEHYTASISKLHATNRGKKKGRLVVLFNRAWF